MTVSPASVHATWGPNGIMHELCLIQGRWWVIPCSLLLLFLGFDWEFLSGFLSCHLQWIMLDYILSGTLGTIDWEYIENNLFLVNYLHTSRMKGKRRVIEENGKSFSTLSVPKIFCFYCSSIQIVQEAPPSSPLTITITWCLGTFTHVFHVSAFSIEVEPIGNAYVYIYIYLYLYLYIYICLCIEREWGRDWL